LPGFCRWGQPDWRRYGGPARLVPHECTFTVIPVGEIWRLFIATHQLRPDGKHRLASATPHGRHGHYARRRLCAHTVVADGTSGPTARPPRLGLRILSCKIRLNLSLRAIGSGGDTWRRFAGSVSKVLFAKKGPHGCLVAASHLAGRPRNAANRRGPGDPPHHHHRLVGHDRGPGVA
jgi:hypothetical protein